MSTTNSSKQANELAERLIQGATELAQFSENLSDSEWNNPVNGDGRSIGVVVHHVASVYPIEVELARAIADGNAITDVTWNAIHEMNAKHASDHSKISREETLRLLRENSNKAADSIREFSDADLAVATPNSLYFNAPLTAQFFIEDHALRHSYHHLGKIRESV